MEKQLRCKECKWFEWVLRPDDQCRIRAQRKPVNPGQFACKKFVLKDKVTK